MSNILYNAYLTNRLFLALTIMVSLAVLPCHASVAHGQQTKKIAGKTYTRLPQKTNGSGVQVYHMLSSKAALGKTITLTLKVDALKTGKKGTMTVMVDPALGAKDNQIQWSLSQQRLTTTVTLTPLSEGLHYVKVFTEQSTRSSAAEIAIQVGNVVQKPKINGVLVTNPDGEKMIEMKAK